MTQSMTPWTLSGMKEKNGPLEAPFRNWLKALVRQPQDHARFLNMLSMLEHLGSRKIMLSQMNAVLTQEILKHLAEETRHAYFFKRQAEKIAGRELDGFTDDNTMARIPAAMYFGRLDATLSRTVPENSHPETAYLWVSLIIELRACWTYHMYQDVLEEADVNMSLKSVIAEEDMHLQDMFARLQEIGDVPAEQIDAMCAVETDLFGTFWTYLNSVHSLQKAA